MFWNEKDFDWQEKGTTVLVFISCMQKVIKNTNNFPLRHKIYQYSWYDAVWDGCALQNLNPPHALAKRKHCVKVVHQFTGNNII